MRLVLAAALTALLVVLAVWVNALRGQSTCEVLKVQVEQSLTAINTPGSPGFAYYQDHPDELGAAIAQSETLRDKLPC